MVPPHLPFVRVTSGDVAPARAPEGRHQTLACSGMTRAVGRCRRRFAPCSGRGDEVPGVCFFLPTASGPVNARQPQKPVPDLKTLSAHDFRAPKFVHWLVPGHGLPG